MKFYRPILLTVDPRQIRTAIKNIIENGQKYTAAQSEPVAVSIGKDPDRVTITVPDRGIGIPEEERERILPGRQISHTGNRRFRPGTEHLQEYRGCPWAAGSK